MKFPAILLLDLKRAVQLDHSKNMSVPVSTCTSYDFNTLISFVWKLWHWKGMCVSTSYCKNGWLVFIAMIQH